LNQPIEVNISPLPGEKSALPDSVRSAGRKILRLPIFKGLRPWARQVAAVAQNPGKLWINAHPARKNSKESPTLTIMSANLWHDWPRYWRLEQRLEAFARLVEAERVDILLLQEVSRTPTLRVDEWLANRLGMAYIYSRANGHSEIGFEEGLGIFSRFSISEPQLTQLGSRANPFVRRLVLGAAVDTPYERLNAFSVHLGLSRRNNRAQAAELHRWVSGHSQHRTVLVGGDFNANEQSTQIRRMQSTWLDTFRHVNPQGDGHTHVLRWPWGGVLHKHRLDYIFLHNNKPRWKVIEARHLTTPGYPHSDHKSVLARLSPILPATLDSSLR